MQNLIHKCCALLSACFFCLPSFAESRACWTGNDGVSYIVEFCSNNIIRFRAGKNLPGESLMERYGIVNVSECDGNLYEDVNTIRLNCGGYTVAVDKKSSVFSVLDMNNKEVIGNICYHKGGSELVNRLSSVIKDRYAGLHVRRNGGIIGDDDGSLTEKDKTEGGDPDKCCVFNMRVADSERFYGGGSTSREHIQHRGEILRMWATYQLSEIPMPFLMSSAGYGIYSNSTCRSYFDVACTSTDQINIYNTDSSVDVFIMLSDSMSGVLDLYTKLTGRNYLLPKWAYGFCFGPNMKENQWEILSDAVRMRDMGVSCDVLWLEPQWMSKHYDFSTSKSWNYDMFTPEPFWKQNKTPKSYYESMFVGRLKAMGYHLGLWVCEEYDPSITEEDMLAEKTGGKQSGLEHWMDHLATFIDMGVEGFKLDPARTLDEHTYRKYYNRQPDRMMHNLNQVLLPKQMSMMYRNHTGKRGWYHYCGGWAGTQHWGASTSGDNGGDKVALFDQLNLGNSGYMNTSCDVMYVPEGKQMQSLHFGTFLPWLQVNSWCSMFQPFYYSASDQVIYRNCIDLRYSLLPYIYSTAIEGVLNGMPMVRSMPLSFPEDRTVDDMWQQYMFGPWLCVGIFTDEIYLPEGVWYNAWNNEKVESKGETVKVECPADRAGILYVRGGAIIPTSQRRGFVGNSPIDYLTLNVYPDGQSSYRLYDCDAESFGYEQGLIASRLFECSRDGSKYEFKVNAVEGTFENMPQHMHLDFRFHISNKPSRVAIDGKVLSRKEWTFDGNGVLEFNLENVPQDASINIMIK